MTVHRRSVDDLVDGAASACLDLELPFEGSDGLNTALLYYQAPLP